MRFQAGIQIILLVVAVVLAFSVIRPKIDSIRAEQNEVNSYKAAVENINQYNQHLQRLLSQADALSAYDRELLWRYLPEEIDTVQIASDITNIVSQSQLLLLDVAPAGEAAAVSTGVADGSVTTDFVDTNDPMMADGGMGVVVTDTQQISRSTLYAQQFQVSAVGTYDQMKTFLADLERNAYPLRLTSLKFTVEDGSPLVQYALTLETYALPGTATPVNANPSM